MNRDFLVASIRIYELDSREVMDDVSTQIGVNQYLYMQVWHFF